MIKSEWGILVPVPSSALVFILIFTPNTIARVLCHLISETLILASLELVLLEEFFPMPLLLPGHIFLCFQAKTKILAMGNIYWVPFRQIREFD